ncbi:GIY-YIG nuclease family protein [Croceitalea rosinachiae]|uniref:GIY-YIG nuclease family protein n=1 Tax=Croceitalea rosinachiae TaxID=3075596 RepID=A0ABU3A5P2_9FLAO|nr:GIY-YIG nuclease family protein [Croceitalea sp. F388]MDT0605484.1 GIY-YIG nuclease family protein [Croceitalea sp. F388]
MCYYFYAIASKKDGRIYKGVSQDVDQRLKWHNEGKTKSTKGYRPWQLVYVEKVDDLKEALEKEKYYKSGIGREQLKELIKQWPRSSAE